MDKIKVLVVPSDRTGVSYFRSIIPHIKLEEYFPSEFHIDIDYEPELHNDSFLSQYDIIHYHRTLGDYEQLPGVLERCDKLGIVTIMDIDDHWSPGPDHPAWEIIKKHELDRKILNNIKVSRNIITTTPFFKKEINRYNKNVYILPNAIDTNEKQYQSNPEKSERIRIGWLGGSSHLKDLEILKGLVSKFKRDGLIDKIQFVLCGYDLRGTLTIIDSKTGEQKQRPIKPIESVWYQYEKIFTDDYSVLSEDYKKFLLTFENKEYVGVENEPYRRVWTKPITSYASNYNLFDISLSPLKESDFNKVKSQLKVIEAGFHKKALIAQNFGPYQIDINNVYEKGGEINEDGNGFLIDTKKNRKFWYNHLKKLILNPDLIKKMGENLYNTVNGTYDMKSVCGNRRKLYKKLISKKKSKEVDFVN
jgi:glycosyltransferase involved in cell wall biosynthesis